MLEIKAANNCFWKKNIPLTFMLHGQGYHRRSLQPHHFGWGTVDGHIEWVLTDERHKSVYNRKDEPVAHKYVEFEAMVCRTLCCSQTIG